MPATETSPNGRRLESWKQIAAYLNREVRTAMRWERERGLPVHRIPGKRSGVYALASEVDAWLRTEVAGNSNSGGMADALPSGNQAGLRKSTLWLVAPAILLLGIVGILLAVSAARPLTPHLRNPVELTNDGLIKGDLMFGARRLFFVASDGERRTVIATSAASAQIATPVYRPPALLDLLSVSPDESEILAWQSGSFDFPCPLWAIPLTNAPPRRLGGIFALGAEWSPDGKVLAYAQGNELYLANREGIMPRRLSALPGIVGAVRWSPDGKRLRIVVQEARWSRSSSIWQVELDRPFPKRFLPGWSRAPQDFESRGRWTPSGDFFVFAAVHDGLPGIFAISERPRFYGTANPVRLTAEAEGVDYPTPSPDGKKILAIVQSPQRGELISYDPKAGQFATWPGMPGLSAGHLAFSPDGQAAAYVSYPEMNLWAMNVDGSGKRQLTSHISRAAMPQWSPDGRRIAFMGWDGGGDERTKIRIMPANGGQSGQPVTWPGWQGVPTWTPDGTSLIFGENGNFNPIPASCTLHRFDFKTGKTSDFPNTTGLWTARTCPTGRYIAATTRDNSKLVLYDMQTARVTDLAAFRDSKVGDNPTWSRDGKFIYIDAPLSSDPAIYRIRIADTHIERVASLKGIQRASAGMDHWIGLTPDGSLLVTREVQGSEIYSWDWVSP